MPGQNSDWKGTEQAIIDHRADPAQREGVRKILHGKPTAPGATHFFVYSSTVVTVPDTLYAPIDLTIDVEARAAKVKIGDLIESVCAPIMSAFDGSPTRSGISLPGGFEYTYAEMGNGNTT